MPYNITHQGMGRSTFTPDQLHIVLISVFAFLIMAALLMTCFWTKKYRSLTRTVRDLKLRQPLSPPPESPADNSYANNITVTFVKDHGPILDTAAISRQYTKSGSRSLWKPPQMTVHLKRGDLSLLQLIKAGREGVFYKAKMTRGTCKGHSMFTCKVTKESVTYKQVQREITIMKKLGNHNNLLQLLDWDITQTPYFLVMDFVSNGTLQNFLQINQDRLSANNDLQHLFTVAAYHIGLAMDHLRNKMVVHCDLALRNIMVSNFPREVKVGEFGLARDLTRMRSRRSGRSKTGDHERIPLRWYPPEYFKDKYYGFKSDVWSFGIVLWEMQTFGTLPYPNLDSSGDVVRHISAGHKNVEPAGCRVEILQMMKDCWVEPYTYRPSFKDIVGVLENILENDGDYVDVDNKRII
ncbi:fibroblast growth factor receptor homolog 1-like isoform X2 [Alosa sapidissima]|uniref:fibroblast growth factor receptor homolog 1-like isoform X2 n=1 Tax=Alosa sapidissima TaxID=34773 RepID=UPI001C083FD9|nr:fibroblast growth factor receptor homolog 1-like isoform X2 [Alosa sapidissima]